jgi:tRNA threonylcarbamoyladenosine biosynthesis protein TsaB
MLTLLIETSTERGVVAILEGLKLISKIELPFGLSNSSYLLPAIENQSHTHRLTIKDFQLIVVGVGPGSYTGIRVAATTAKSLAYASRLPLIGVCSLEGFTPENEGPFAALIDAKIGGAYLLKGMMQKGKCSYSVAPAVFPLEKLQVELQDITTIVTPNSKIIKTKLEELFPDSNWKWEECCPNPIQIVATGIYKFENGIASDVNSLELLYLRKTQAELEREAHKI